MEQSIYPPDDILLLIVQYLQQDRPKGSKPFWCIAEWCKSATESRESSERVKNLRSLMLTSRHLHSLVTPFFYRDILVPLWSVKKRRHVTWKFYQSLKRNLQLAEFIHSAIIDCANVQNFNPSIPVYAGQWQAAYFPPVDPDGTHPDDLSELLAALFWSPNMKTLTLVDFNSWDAFDFSADTNADSEDLIGTSPVTHLKLMHCGSKEPALASILSWPKTLKTLHYDADQGAWEMHYENEPTIEWSCAGFVRTLQPQKHCLEELSMTRPPIVHEGLGNGPRIDLSDFPALKTLRIFHVFLVGFDDPGAAWEGLPPHLEKLQVYYDDTFYTDFFEGYDSPEFDELWFGGLWLRALLSERKTRDVLPNLREITIYTPITWAEEGEEGEAGEEEQRGMQLWSLPRTVRELAAEAGVKVSVWRGVGQDGNEVPGYDALDVL